MSFHEDNENSNINRTPTMMSPTREELSRQPSEASCYLTEEDEEEARLQLGPKCSIKEHLEKDKDDESLRRWKEQLIGNVNAVGDVETLEADVKIVSLTIICPGRPDIILQIPDNEDPKGVWFTLKEGTQYRLKFAIKVSNNIVSGLRYTNTVWKTGLKVDNSKEMLGTFSPQADPYIHEMPEETTPSGYFARGSYSAKSKVFRTLKMRNNNASRSLSSLLSLLNKSKTTGSEFIDDDNKCHLEINYTFGIQKEWLQ